MVTIKEKKSIINNEKIIIKRRKVIILNHINKFMTRAHTTSFYFIMYSFRYSSIVVE